MEQNNNKLSSNEIARYSRHIILPEVGVEGQEKLKKARMLVVGMGGLGSPSSLYLAAAGVGTLGLAEFDQIEEHNLQRQILHHRSDIGKLKINSAEDKLKAINPDCKLVLHREGITFDNALEILSLYDMVIDGSDNLPTRYLVNDAAYFVGIPYIYGSIFKFEGQVSIFDSKAGGPNYRCLFPEMPDPKTVPSCEEAGVFGALCGLIGSLQAMEAIKYHLKIGESLLGRLLVIDAVTMNFRTLKLKHDPQCPLSGDYPTITKLEASNYEYSCDIPIEKDIINGESESKLPIEVDVVQVKAILDSYSLSHETEYVLSIGDGTLWPTSMPLYNECDYDGDCGEGEECRSGKCSTVASEEMQGLVTVGSLSTGYGGTKCTSDADCDGAFECYKETETSLGECTPRMAELYL